MPPQKLVIKEDPKLEVAVRYRQFYEGEEAKAEDQFCILLVPTDKKALLLAGDDGAQSEVNMALFKEELLLIGDGLAHRLEFMETDALADRSKVITLEL